MNALLATASSAIGEEIRINAWGLQATAQERWHPRCLPPGTCFCPELQPLAAVTEHRHALHRLLSVSI